LVKLYFLLIYTSINIKTNLLLSKYFCVNFKISDFFFGVKSEVFFRTPNKAKMSSSMIEKKISFSSIIKSKSSINCSYSGYSHNILVLMSCNLITEEYLNPIVSFFKLSSINVLSKSSIAFNSFPSWCMVYIYMDDNEAEKIKIYYQVTHLKKIMYS